jgi:hypothetical protein
MTAPGGQLPTIDLKGHNDALAKSRQVVAVHLQGHGNTADIDRPYRFEALADDPGPDDW